MQRHLLLLLVLCAVPIPVARGGFVHTRQGRLEGKVSFDVNHVKVEGKEVAWSDVLFLLQDDSKPVPPRSQRLLLKNGEVWGCEVVRLGEQQMTVRGELFGEKKVPMARVAAIEFARSSGFPRKTGTLYRRKGDPIPGELLGIDADTLSIDSILGKLTLPRDELAGYLIAQPTEFEKDIDELALIDGTIFRGRLLPGSDEFQLVHPILGEIRIPARLLRSVVRLTPTVADLTELTPKSAQSLQLVGEESAPLFRTVRGEGREAARFIKGLLIEPRTVLRYELAQGGRPLSFRATVLPLDSAVGDATLRIRSGKSGKDVLLEKELDAGSEPVPITVEVPDSGKLELEVDFGKRLRFPCGIILADPHVIAVKP